MVKSLKPLISRVFRPIPVRILLVAPFLLELSAAIALVGYFSFRNEQKATEKLAMQLQQEITARIEQNINHHLEIPHQINRINISDLQLGRLDLQNPREVARLFRERQLAFDPIHISGIYYGTAEGEFVALSDRGANALTVEIAGQSTQGNLRIYPADDRGNPKPEFSQKGAYDPRVQPWYLKAVAAGKPVWSDRIPQGTKAKPKRILSQPVYNSAGQLAGVVAVDYTICHIEQFLENLNIGKTGMLSIVDRAGEIVAASSPTQGDSTTVQDLQQRLGPLSAISEPKQWKTRINNQKLLVRVVPLRGAENLDWSIVTLIPESDFAAQLQADARHTLLLCIAALGITGAIAILTARWITQPLLDLNEAAQKIARGRWHKVVKTNRSDEIGELARSFNLMAEQLQTAFGELQALNQTVLESEARLLQFLEVLPVGVWVCDGTGKSIYVNQKAHTLLGISTPIAGTPKEMPERYQIYRAGTEQYYPAAEWPMVRALAGESYSADDLERRQGDRAIPLQMWATPIPSETGEVAYAIAAFLDITERKQAEHILAHYNRLLAQQVEERTVALATAEAELESLFAAMSELVFVFDRQGRYLKIVSNAPEFLAQPAEQLLGKTIDEVFDPDRAAGFLNCIERVLNNQQTLHLDYSLDLKGKTVWFEASISPMSQDTVVWVARDISDRKVLEDKLRTSQDKLRALFEAMPDLVLIIDEQNNIEVAPTNPTFLYPGDLDLLDPTIEQFWSEENGSLWFAKIQQARNSQQVVDFDYRLPINSSTVSEVWFSAQIAPLPDRSAIWVARDISDRKAAEAAILEAKEAAVAANRAKSTFLANMSHELRTPLNAILGFAQLLARVPDLDRDRQENLNIICRSGEHLLTLINQVLDLSKIEAGRATLKETNFDLFCLLDDLEDLFQLKAQTKGLTLVFQRSADVPQYIYGDRIKLNQILINLLSNAMKFTQTGGVIVRVTVFSQQSSVNSQQSAVKTFHETSVQGAGEDIVGAGLANSSPEQPVTHQQNPPSEAKPADPGQITLLFEIEDTGPGIPSEELPQLFEPFTQTQIGQASHEGTGLGLSIVQKFLQLMGGDVAVTSRGQTFTPASSSAWIPSTPSATTTFAFRIPVRPIDATLMPERADRGRVIALAPNQPRYRVLVVDDKDYNRRLLVKLLAPIGFEVREAQNGQEALEIWSTWQPHLIWMDMRMPVMDGYEATRQIKTHLKGQATAVIALTASTLEEERAIVLSAGCDDYARKPFTEQIIFDKIAQYLGVSYIYEELTSTSDRGTEQQKMDSQTVAVDLSGEPSLLSLLAAMPSEWTDRLDRAANLIDNEQIFRLIAEIPSDRARLARTLEDWTNSFRCDKIIDLIEMNSQQPNKQSNT